MTCTRRRSGSRYVNASALRCSVARRAADGGGGSRVIKGSTAAARTFADNSATAARRPPPPQVDCGGTFHAAPAAPALPPGVPHCEHNRSTLVRPALARGALPHVIAVHSRRGAAQVCTATWHKRRALLVACFFVAVAHLLPRCSAAFTCSNTDTTTCAALGDLYTATNGSSWTNKNGWISAAGGTATDYCTFQSLGCNGLKVVTSL